MDPYKSGLFARNPYVCKRPCSGRMVVVLDGKMEERKLKLINPISRALLQGEIHELIVTDEAEAAPGRQVDRIAYWGFFEVEAGTVVVTGDEIMIGEAVLGTIAGFDETHMPNHLNIVIKAENRDTGVDLGISLDDRVLIYKKKEECFDG